MNMHKLIINREHQYTYDLDDKDAVLWASNHPEIQSIMDHQNVTKRFLSRPCEILSVNETVKEKDFNLKNEPEDSLKPHFTKRQLVFIQKEMVAKEITQYKSFAEIKLCSKLSTTPWDDAINVSWEKLG
jgi:hypothetical protein